MTFQVARVKKALGTVSQMVKNGDKLVFDQDSIGKDMSYIQNKRTNEKIGKWCVRLGPDGGTPEMRNDRNTDAHFHRQGQLSRHL